MRLRSPVGLFRLTLLSLALSQTCGGNAWATSDAERIADLEAKLAQSVQQIERLANRLDQLEKDKTAQIAATPAAPAITPATAATTTTTTEQNARLEAVEHNLAQLADASARTPDNAGVPIHGFLDVGYDNSGKQVDDNRKSGFTLGNADFYLTPDFGGRVKGLLELNFEWNDAGLLTTDTERMQLGYTVSDNLTVWAGRFHTPFGYWNTAYHHGAQIQTSVTRPKMIAFEDEGGFVPSHTVGLWATGSVNWGDGKLDYDAYVGNGQRILSGQLDFNGVRDDNNNKMIGGNLHYRFPGALDGLILGTHAFREQVDSYADILVPGVITNTTQAVGTSSTPSNSTMVTMFGAYGFYDADDWEIISEYYHFNDKNLSGNTGNHTSWASFAQIGRNLGGNWIPYARYEIAELNQADNYFYSQTIGSQTLGSGLSYKREVIGLRYDLTPKSALKVEVNHTDESKDGGQKYNEAMLQFATRF